MLYEEVSFIFLYVSAFGFSDYFVEKMKFNGIKKLFYYFILLSIGVIGVYFCKHCKKLQTI
jgi:hypothetical protein